MLPQGDQVLTNSLGTPIVGVRSPSELAPKSPQDVLPRRKQLLRRDLQQYFFQYRDKIAIVRHDGSTPRKDLTSGLKACSLD
uniref:AlNc14C250G9635 protein n=1 Tax=Albugo laibachii Nc14 TaxID=890382 RepID=F0WTF6_9STRA|nr:AlNc14C250G9635 [Albugo laibachii Nc14]|eukprot:CCA24646.1 AlNc14C250G9635 [Albugo laibachii Nc14]